MYSLPCHFVYLNFPLLAMGLAVKVFLIVDEVSEIAFVYFAWNPNHSIALLTVAVVVAVADAEFVASFAVVAKAVAAHFDSAVAIVIVVAVVAIDLVVGVAPAVVVVFLTDLSAPDFQA